MLGYCVPKFKKLPAAQKEKFDNLLAGFKSSSVGGIIYELYTTKKVLISCVIVACGLALLYITLMEHLAVFVLWTSVVLTWVGLISVGAIAFNEHKSQKENA